MATLVLRAFGRMATSLQMERLHPWLLALIVGGVAFWFGWTPDEGQALLSATINFGAIVSGFVGTALSILTTLGTQVMQEIRRTAYLKVVRDYLASGLASGIILACVSMAGLAGSLHHFSWFFAVWLGAVVFCLASLRRLAATILLIFTDPKHRPGT